jgi:hypothetical protein
MHCYKGLLLFNNIYTAKPLYTVENLSFSFNGTPFCFTNIAL